MGNEELVLDVEVDELEVRATPSVSLDPIVL